MTAIYDENPSYPVERRITRKPKPDEARAVADLIKAVRRAAAQIIAEQEREQRKPVAERWRRGA